MTALTPFPLAELVTGRGTDRCDVARDDRLELGHAGRAHHRHAMTFVEFRSSPLDETEPSRCYTAEDLAKAVDEARQVTARDVEAEVRVAMAREIEKRRCDALEKIRDQLASCRKAFDTELASMAWAGERLAVALAKAVIPRAIERQPLADIAHVLKSTLVRLVAQPSIEVRLPVDLGEAEPAFLNEVTKEAGFTGEVIMVVDPDLQAGDVKMRWRGGELDRQLERLQREAEAIVDDWQRELSNMEDEEGVLPLQHSATDPPISVDGPDQTINARSEHD